MAKAKLLLVEDDVALLKMYEKKFLADDYEVEIAYDGEEGLKKAGEKDFDLIVLDVMLPKIKGPEVFKKLRSNATTFKTPVLMLTNVDKEETIFECFSLGAVDYLVKSEVSLQEVVQKIEELLKNSSKIKQDN